MALSWFSVSGIFLEVKVNKPCAFDSPSKKHSRLYFCTTIKRAVIGQGSKTLTGVLLIFMLYSQTGTYPLKTTERFLLKPCSNLFVVFVCVT